MQRLSPESDHYIVCLTHYITYFSCSIKGSNTVLQFTLMIVFVGTLYNTRINGNL